MSISKALKSNLLLTQHPEIQAHQNLGLKQISWAVGNTLLQDHDRVEFKKPLQETLEANFSQRGSIILGFGGPHHSFQGNNALSMYWCCQPGNGASRVPAKGTTGCESLLHSPSFILLLRAWVWGFFHIAAPAVSHQPQHTSSVLHTHCHSLPSFILKNFNVFLLLLVLWFCSVSGFWINILPHVWSCISSPWQPIWPSLSFLRWSYSFLASWVTQPLHYPYVLAFHPWSASVSEGSFGAGGGSERRCERPWNGLPPSSALIHFWTCNKTRLRQPAWRVRAHRWGYRKPPPHCWGSARSSCPGRNRRREGKEGTRERRTAKLIWDCSGKDAAQHSSTGITSSSSLNEQVTFLREFFNF